MKKDVVNYLEFLRSRGIRSISKVASATVKESATSRPEAITDTRPELITLDGVKEWIGECKKCRLHELRKNIVFGEGNINATLMFIGEGPGEDEDNSGRPFVGRAGQLLTKIIEAMKLTREDVYIANIVKCRPPNNRTPSEDEIITCSPYLMKQIHVIKPKIVVTLGAPATCTMFNQKIKISTVRGQFYDWKDGIKLMPTFHPAYLLRNPVDKKLVWEDMQKVMELLGIK